MQSKGERSFLRMWEVQDDLKISRSTINNYLNRKSRHHRPNFPRPKKDGSIIVFYKHEIEAYKDSLPRV